MSDEVHEIEEVEAARETTEPAESAVDGDESPANQEVEIVAEGPDVVTYNVSRGAWDFTDSQRVILAILIWLNIMMFVIGYLAISGQLRI